MFKPLLISIITIGVASSAFADAPSTINSISVTGKHQRMVAADGYDISAELIVRHAKRSEVQTRLEEKRKPLNKLIHDFDLEKKQYGYTQSALREEYQWRDGKREFVGYVLQESWWMSVKGQKQNAKMLTRLGKIPEVDRYQSQPKSASQSSYREALRLAIQDARQKAQAMADELNICLGKPITVQEQHYGSQVAPQRMFKAMSTMESAQASSEQPEAKVRSQAQVSVEWSLVDCD